jgi:hypothetical protein
VKLLLNSARLSARESLVPVWCKDDRVSGVADTPMDVPDSVAEGAR